MQQGALAFTLQIQCVGILDYSFCTNTFLWKFKSKHLSAQCQVLDEAIRDKPVDEIKIMHINTQLSISNSWDNSLNPISSLYIFARGRTSGSNTVMTGIATVTKGAGRVDRPIPNHR